MVHETEQQAPPPHAKEEDKIYTMSHRDAENIFSKCARCKTIVYNRDLEKNSKVCTCCGYHFRLTATERIALITDPGSFIEIDADLVSSDPLHFVSHAQSYAQKLESERKKLGMNTGVITGHALLESTPIALAIMDFRFIGGSMGTEVGEKIARVVELALEHRMALLISSASGGARMQEGIYSLMQMAKTTLALTKFARAGLPYISLLTDPTTGGVSASFAMLGDVILAEPGSLICFAGPRVIEQFMHVRIPYEEISAEAALQHGFLDAVVHRHELRTVLARLLRFYRNAGIVQSEGYIKISLW